MLVKCFFGLVLLVHGLFHVFGRFVGWFWFEKICSTSPPRGNQVDGLPRASSDKKMVDPDFVQDHSGKVPEGKGDLNT